MKTFLYFLPKGLIALEVQAKNLTEAKKIIRRKHDLKKINLEIWESLTLN